MSLAKIIWAVAVLAAIIFAFVTFEYAGLILVILGLAGGWFVSLEHRRGVLVAAIFLIAGGAGHCGCRTQDLRRPRRQICDSAWYRHA